MAQMGLIDRINELVKIRFDLHKAVMDYGLINLSDAERTIISKLDSMSIGYDTGYPSKERNEAWVLVRKLHKEYIEKRLALADYLLETGIR